MAPKVLCIVHQEQSDPGRVGVLLRQWGYELELRRPPLGDPLPADMNGYAAAIVFGGPMSANDDHLPFIQAETDFVGRVAESGRPFLGICLGAQMLCRALGGRVGPHPDGFHEIGYFRIRPTQAGLGLFEEMQVYQWHGEGFEVPKCCRLLAEGEHFTNQAFRYGDRAYAIQFHPEVTRPMMERWTRRAAHRLVLPGAQARDRQLECWARFDPAVGAWVERFLRKWLGLDCAAATAPRDEVPAPLTA